MAHGASRYRVVFAEAVDIFKIFVLDKFVPSVAINTRFRISFKELGFLFRSFRGGVFGIGQASLAKFK